MLTGKRLFAVLALASSGLLVSSCAIKDLNEDIKEVRENYGYLKGRVAGHEDETDILIALFRHEPGGMTMVKARSTSPGEHFYLLVPQGGYTLMAFSDSNGDFAYQPGEAAFRTDDPVINWFNTMAGQDRVDVDALAIQQIELASSTVLDQKLDLSLSALHAESKFARNVLRIVSWDDVVFSAKNTELGMWRPGAFVEEVGYGLYVLKEFNPTQKSILLVHGINDTPRVFEELVGAIPADYQLLLFHYPGALPLEYTSYMLNEALDEIVRRYQIPQLDIIAHSMGGLVSKGMLYRAEESLRKRLRVFISMASPFGGHSSAAAGLKWSPVIAPVWWAMAPDSSFLQKIDSVDLTQGPNHHLIYAYSHTLGGKRKKDDGVVTVESQLIESARRNAIATYGIADNHVGVVTNACTLALVPAVLEDGTSRVTNSECSDTD